MSSTDDPIILFFVLLAVACHLFLFGVLVLGVIGSFSPAGRVRRRSMIRGLAPIAAPFAFCVAAVTMAGSLYMSEVKHWLPCHLCWIQRALLYPQVLFMAALAFRPQWAWLRRLAIGALVVDIPVSAYHTLLQRYPSIETSSCDFSNPCTQQYIDQFQYISEPLMALTAASTILALVLIQRSVSVAQMAIWSATSLVTLGILLWVSSETWAIAPLPIAVFIAMTVFDRRSTKTA